MTAVLLFSELEIKDSKFKLKKKKNPQYGQLSIIPKGTDLQKRDGSQ